MIRDGGLDVKYLVQMIQEMMIKAPHRGGDVNSTPLGHEAPVVTDEKRISPYFRDIVLCDGVPVYWIMDGALNWPCLENYHGYEKSARTSVYPYYMAIPNILNLEKMLPQAVKQTYVNMCNTNCGNDVDDCSNRYDSFNRKYRYWVGENDNFAGVAQFWGPMATNLSALVVAGFFIDMGVIDMLNMSGGNNINRSYGVEHRKKRCAKEGDIAKTIQMYKQLARDREGFDQ